MSWDVMQWGAAGALVLLVWWLAGRPGWPRRRPPPLPAPPTVSGLDTPPQLESLPDDDEAAAARATEAALREAQDSARRELAARELAEREAAERAAAERQARATEAARRQADAEAAQRLAEAARRRAEQEAAARREAARVQAQQLEAQRQAALRQEAEHRAAEQAARDRAAAEQAARDRAAAEQAARDRAAAEQAAAAAARAAAARALAPPPPAARLAEQTLVMVADDSKVVRVKTSRLLASRHFQVMLAEDGEQALALMAGQMPHLLITDVEMPGLDGLELTRRLRADARSAALPVIMITSADDRLRDEAQAAGVTLLMGKPYGDEQLLDQVARLTGVSAG